jgi:hypothetical protein
VARARGQSKATRVGDIYHDLMGFTVAGADSFLASGHPDAQHDFPPQMGLQRSTNGGRSWKTVSRSAKRTCTSCAPPGSACTAWAPAPGLC